MTTIDETVSSEGTLKWSRMLTAKAEWNTRGDGANPVTTSRHDGRGTCPTEDEECYAQDQHGCSVIGDEEVRTDRNPDTADHHANETVFGLSLATLGCRTLHVVPLQEWHDGEGEGKTDPDRNKRETNKAIIPVIVTAEDNGVTEEEGVLYDC